jgi:hypothetical protein
MPSVQQPRGTRAALDALATAGTILPGQVYLITDEARLAVGLTASTYQAFLKSGEGGGGSGAAGTVVLTVPPGSMGHTETLPASGVQVGSVLLLTLGAHGDGDENCADLLDIGAMGVTPGTGEITVTISFLTPAGGAINLNWSAL